MTGTLRYRGTMARLASEPPSPWPGAWSASARWRRSMTLDVGPDRRLTVTFSVPEFYSSCQSSGLTDSVTTTGVPANWRLRGQILVGYIGPLASSW